MAIARNEMTAKPKQAPELIKSGRATMSPSYNPRPLVLERGQGVRVYDIDGRSYLDFLAGIAVNLLGYGHPSLTEALRSRIETGLLHTSNGFFTAPQVQLQCALVENSFADRVFLANSGAEANEAAIKLARRYQRTVANTPRFEIITFENSFHGRTIGALSATGQPKYHEGFEPLVPGFLYARFNDLAHVESLIGEHTAAIMLEPVQGEAGVFAADQAFMSGLRDLCDKHGILLILDEIQCGMGRTGRLFAHEQYGVEPDIMTLAKGLGGGVPIGAMLARDSVFAGFVPGSHATTFGGNPVAATAALTVLGEVTAPGFCERVKALGDMLRSGCEEIAAAHEVVTEVRGLGLMLGIAVDGGPSVAGAVADECRARGLLVNAAGGRAVRLVPPLVITEADIEEALSILGAAFAAVTGGGQDS